MPHIKLEVRNSRGRVVNESIIPRGTEWFLPRRFEFCGSNLYIEGSETVVMPKWGRTVPPGGRLEIGATE